MIEQQEFPGQFAMEHYEDDGGGIAPPRFIIWLAVGLLLLGAVGAITGVVIFRELVQPRYQQEIVERLPFMEVFLPSRPTDATLPTVVPPADGNISPADLLSGPLVVPTADAPAEEEADAPALPDAETAAPPAEAGDEGALAPPAAPIETASESEPVAEVAPVAVAVAQPAPVADAQTVALTGDATLPVTADPLAAAVEAGNALPASARIFGLRHVQQGWNNCGPANITMALSFYGWQDGQQFAADFLKPDAEDKNVSPHEMVAFVNERSALNALYRPGGDLELLKAFLANDIPVIVETGYMPEGYAWLGHYQTVVGYDDTQQTVWLLDSFLGAGENGEGITESYEELNSNWQAFNRNFIVLYEPQREALVQEILGDLSAMDAANQRALAVARQEARSDPQNGFAWFNIGTSLSGLGRHQEASAAFDQARNIGVPWRMLWYQFGPFESYFEVGRYDDVLSLANVNLNNGGEFVEETHYWQGRVFAELGEDGRAASAFNRAIQHNTRYAAARQALASLASA